MKALITSFTLHLREALSYTEKKENEVVKHRSISNILLGGMGGSGIGCNMISAIYQDKINVPILIQKGYSLPKFVNSDTLFIACSYSGNTEETLALVKEAYSRTATVVCITSGGEMLKQAEKYGLDCIRMPEGCPSPRAMIGYATVALFQALRIHRLVDTSFVDETNRSISLLDNLENAIQQRAKKIAESITGKLPVIYCGENIGAIALRFQQQINENANQFAHIGIFPEMNHNEIVGWEHPEDMISQLQPIYIHSDYDHDRIKERMEICRRIIEKKTSPIIDIYAQGSSLIEHYHYLLHLTDWISYFLAEQNKVDPSLIESITYLKQELSKST